MIAPHAKAGRDLLLGHPPHSAPPLLSWVVRAEVIPHPLKYRAVAAIQRPSPSPHR
jgi:hypothetical protein